MLALPLTLLAGAKAREPEVLQQSAHRTEAASEVLFVIPEWPR